MAGVAIRQIDAGLRGGASKAFQYNYLMSHSDDLQRWGRAWKVAGVHLADERAARLRAMTDEETRKIITRIFSGPQPPVVERESGLLEQQRLFRKLR